MSSISASDWSWYLMQVNWTQFEQRNITGGLLVEPESSVVSSTALVLSRVGRDLCDLRVQFKVTL